MHFRQMGRDVNSNASIDDNTMNKLMVNSESESSLDEADLCPPPKAQLE